ncbi:MAG: hypothetical protein JW940_06740 [Polyangiaceae bacterium]|nr:hypothetical protein [Polyangiaceae bacterium]
MSSTRVRDAICISGLIVVGCGSDQDVQGNMEAAGGASASEAIGGTATATTGGQTNGTGGVQAAGGQVSSSGTGGQEPVAGDGGSAPTGGTTGAGTGGVDSQGATGGAQAADGTGGGSQQTECPAPPAGAPAAAVTALDTENAARLAMGIPCAELVLELCQSSQNHCDYYVTNADDATCEADSAHSEVEGCPGYTGAAISERLSAAGYSGRGANECMAFMGDPVRAVTMFINSVYHRTPLLSPWTRHVGYGSGDGCDTMDFGQGPVTPDDVTAFYPYAGQSGVPVSFDGSREGPEPPVPPSGWPSGYPVTLFARGITVTSHSILIDGTSDPLPHVWIEPANNRASEYVLYTETPLAPTSTYRVIIDAMRGAESLHFEWTFTTGEQSTRRGG